MRQGKDIAMKETRQWTGRMTGLLALIGILIMSAAARGQSAAPAEWPRVFVKDGVTNTLYQPQLQSWDYFTLKAISAVAVRPAGAAQPEFGTIHFLATTRVDRAERQVYFDKIEIEQGMFPSAGAPADKYLATLRSLLPDKVPSMSLDRLEASLAILQAGEKAKGVPLKNDPPAIVFSTVPAMLVMVDGPAVYGPVEGTKLQRVLNTRALILRDPAGALYLHLFDGYVTATALGGPWTIPEKVRADVKTAEKEAVKAKQVDLLAGQVNPETKKKPSLKDAPIPTVHVATVPTELIVIQGDPEWGPVPPTQLLWVANTVSHVFKSQADQQVYVLLSGRWFSAASFDGPWKYVPGSALPKDFADIPDDSPMENVKASVPGTEQAQEAAIANSVPQTVKVDRKKARMDPEPKYEGAPILRAVDGTPLFYAANCQTPVIQVDAKTWYACQNGVWFAATSAMGPWVAATSVPAVIYSIPPSSPMRYLVYARIHRYDDRYIWVVILPGFYGTEVDPDGVVVYGTGYYYSPYVGPTMYVCYPVTYGYGCNPCWTPWVGWSYGFAVCWSTSASWYWWCGCPPAPYWGPYYGWCYGSYYNAYGGITAWGPYGWAGTSGYIYHQNGPWTGVSRAAAGYNAWTGNQWASQYGRAYNSTTGTSIVGQRGAVQNVYTGNYAYGGRGAFYNNQTGAAGTGGKVTWGNANTGNTGTAGRADIYNPNTGNTTHVGGIKGENGGAINVNGNVIVGNDGNYYRPDGSGGWEQVTRPGAGGGGQAQQWQQSNLDAQQRQSLDNQSNARQMGAQRQQSFQGNRPRFRGGGGGRRR
jgi:hypothetical protein